MNLTPFETVQKLAEKGNVIPIFSEELADTETPISALLKMREGADHLFLLESVEGGERSGRYSFIGRDPFLKFNARGQQIKISGEREASLIGDPIAELKKIFNQYQSVPLEGLPPFSGGGVGYIAYDSIRMIEAIPDNGIDTLKMPDIQFGFYDSFLVFDNLKHKLLLVANVRADLFPLEKAYDKAVHQIRQLKEYLARPFPRDLSYINEPGEIKSNFSREEFKTAVNACKEYIKAGDAFQIVLSQRLSIKPGCSAIDIYRSLRTINPSDYMYYLRFDDAEIAGASPELLVKVDNTGKIQTCPIAGTRPRGKNYDEDLALEKELLADEKERAEHLMLIDLGRNDIGKVSQIGTVHPTDFMIIRRYSHVMHIVSTVEGKLKKDMDPLDALFSCFPAGTLSGAPKIRAMEIIEELENLRRGVYGGAICYRDFSGNLDSCIAIRTMVMKDGIAHIQAGAGIVADSDPNSEYEETLAKSNALVRAIRSVSQMRNIL
jgi:anthranilate synthase component 1